jgi:hypothetical protein
MFKSGSNLSELHIESRNSYHIQNSANLTVFKISGLEGIATFSLDSIMSEGMGLAFNKDHEAL